MINFFNELDLALTVVTETWFHSGDNLSSLQEAVFQEAGLKSIDRNHPCVSPSNPGEGVSIVFNPAKIVLKEFPFKRGLHELIAASGRIRNNMRPFFVIAKS